MDNMWYNLIGIKVYLCIGSIFKNMKYTKSVP